MDAQFGRATFRVFRNVYECVIDDLLVTHGGAFSFCDLKWEKAPANRENTDLVLQLMYQGKLVLTWVSKDTTLEYYWSPRSRLN